jgi:hypothetical protein|tara:strand:+ start:1192 stop:2028 length:837 start_codon:yes stop_codon:yes gene_type:complete
MNEEQVSNASDSTEVPESFISDDASSDFFGNLDKSVNGGILDSEESITSIEAGGNTQAESGVQQENVETLKKRYTDSSNEGRRLNSRLKELEPYLPILDEMRKDPKLITHVRDYFDGGGQTPESVTQKLNLDEDFIFDPDDAVTNPKSDSAKVLNQTIDGVVQRRLTNEFSRQKEQQEVDTQVNDFKKNHNMSEEDWNEFQSYAENQTLSLDDILYLKNKEADTNQRARVDNTSAARQLQQQPASAATVGSNSVQVSEEDDVFDAILGIDKQLDNAFG